MSIGTLVKKLCAIKGKRRKIFTTVNYIICSFIDYRKITLQIWKKVHGTIPESFSNKEEMISIGTFVEKVCAIKCKKEKF